MTITKIKLGFVTALVIAGWGATLFIQHGRVQRLQAENQVLRVQNTEVQSLRDENARLQNAPGGVADAERLRAENERLTKDHSELLKLRGEVGLLRRQVQTGESNPQLIRRLQAENDALRSQSTQDSVTAKQLECIHNLRQLDGAKAQWALENKKTDTDDVTLVDLAPYLAKSQIPICPAEGTYSVSKIGIVPICTVPGHAL